MKNNWYVEQKNKIFGPFSDSKLKKLVKDGKIKPTTQIKLQEDGKWRDASKVKGLFQEQRSTPPAQSEPKVVDGWQKAKWGMTPQEVLAAYPNAHRHSEPIEYDNYFVPLELLKVSFGDLKTNVKFQFLHDDGTLRQILLIPDRESSPSARTSFERLIKMTTAQYGAPQLDGEREKVWIFPQTEISASILDSLGISQSTLAYTSKQQAEAQRAAIQSASEEDIGYAENISDADFEEAEIYYTKATHVLCGVQANIEVYGSNAFSPDPEDIDVALQYINRSLEHFPENPAYLNLKGLLLWEGKGDKNSAKPLIERAAKLAPRDIDIQNNFNAINTSGCFVATAAFGSPTNHHVNVLRGWRDRRLRQSMLGRIFIRAYYKFGPYLAYTIGLNSVIRTIARLSLIPIVRLVEMLDDTG